MKIIEMISYWFSSRSKIFNAYIENSQLPVKSLEMAIITYK